MKLIIPKMGNSISVVVYEILSCTHPITFIKGWISDYFYCQNKVFKMNFFLTCINPCMAAIPVETLASRQLLNMCSGSAVADSDISITSAVGILIDFLKV